MTDEEICVRVYMHSEEFFRPSTEWTVLREKEGACTTEMLVYAIDELISSVANTALDGTVFHGSFKLMIPI